jgi:hypothetical protein
MNPIGHGELLKASDVMLLRIISEGMASLTTNVVILDFILRLEML